MAGLCLIIRAVQDLELDKLGEPCTAVLLKSTIIGDEVQDPLQRLSAIKERFQPHKTILYVRDPFVSIVHLRRHCWRGPQLFDTKCSGQESGANGYGCECGSPLGKVRAQGLFWKAGFKAVDAIVKYEEVVSRDPNVASVVNRLGLELKPEHYDMKRPNADVRARGMGVMGKWPFAWDMGDVKDGPIFLKEKGREAHRDCVGMPCPELHKQAYEVLPFTEGQYDSMKSHLVEEAQREALPAAEEVGKPVVKPTVSRKEGEPLRLLVTCLQSAGCSLFMKLLGQVPGAVSFVDVFVQVRTKGYPMPRELQLQNLKEPCELVALKSTILGDEVDDPIGRLEKIKARFEPHLTILYVRDPLVSHGHLRRHCRRPDEGDTKCEGRESGAFGYGCECGSPVGKMRALAKIWQERRRLADAVVKYEDVTSRSPAVIDIANKLGIKLSTTHFDMPVRNAVVKSRAMSVMGRPFAWDMGDVKDGPIFQKEQARSGLKSCVQVSCAVLAERTYKIMPFAQEDYDKMKSHLLSEL
eukprot:TRINITY_DN12226_c0_g1_i1.p1 TRINITY_DN12226_c0_g1~~TRINITY_DN12226_c0_g1_i1.p1  ORF type:complete len:525 (+),score=110.84 TRINITY_DN12226_c0_g1_i1:94-1668(+)